MATLFSPVESEFLALDLRNEDSSLGFLLNLSYFVLYLLALIALKELWHVFLEVGWYVCWWIRVTVKKSFA